MIHKGKSITIDGKNLALHKGTGIATYARNLSHSLHKLDYDVNILYGKPVTPGKSDLIREISFFDALNNEHLISNKYSINNYLSIGSQLITNPFGQTAIETPITGKVIANKYKNKLPYYDSLWNAPWIYEIADIYFKVTKRFYPVELPNKPDIVHWTYPAPLWVKGAKNIYTIHDIVPLRLPYTTLDKKHHYLRLINSIIKRADHICTVSETSKNDLINILDAPEDKITNTYQTVNIPESYLTDDIDKLNFKLDNLYDLFYKSYFLFFGAIEPKKNVSGIVEGFLSSNIDSELILASSTGWMSKQELHLILDPAFRSNKKDEYIIRDNQNISKIEHTSYEHLVNLIQGAKAVIFPSLYEGFGLPILESMTCGTPVITSNFGAMKEIAGDAALLVDPYNVRDIRDAIRLLDDDSNLRKELSNKGLSRAKFFNQDNYITRLKNMYDNFDSNIYSNT